MEKRLLKDEKYIKCPICKKIVIRLVYLNDNRTGKQMCIDCKRKYKKEHPEQDFRGKNGINE